MLLAYCDSGCRGTQDFEIGDVRVDEGEDVTVESGGHGGRCLGLMIVQRVKALFNETLASLKCASFGLQTYAGTTKLESSIIDIDLISFSPHSFVVMDLSASRHNCRDRHREISLLSSFVDLGRVLPLVLTSHLFRHHFRDQHGLFFSGFRLPTV